MQNLYARSVFFVKDAERSLRFYTDTLGFTLDWNHQEQARAFVFQVSLFGFQLILNQEEDWTVGWAGHGCHPRVQVIDTGGTVSIGAAPVRLPTGDGPSVLQEGSGS